MCDRGRIGNLFIDSFKRLKRLQIANACLRPPPIDTDTLQHTIKMTSQAVPIDATTNRSTAPEPSLRWGMAKRLQKYFAKKHPSRIQNVEVSRNNIAFIRSMSRIYQVIQF